MTLYSSNNQFSNLSIKYWTFLKFDFPLKYKKVVEIFSVSSKTLIVTKNNDFTCFCWFFLVVKNHQKAIYEYILESGFLSFFFNKWFYVADIPEVTQFFFLPKSDLESSFLQSVNTILTACASSGSTQSSC